MPALKRGVKESELASCPTNTIEKEEFAQGDVPLRHSPAFLVPTHALKEKSSLAAHASPGQPKCCQQSVLFFLATVPTSTVSAWLCLPLTKQQWSMLWQTKRLPVTPSLLDVNAGPSRVRKTIATVEQ